VQWSIETGNFVFTKEKKMLFLPIETKQQSKENNNKKCLKWESVFIFSLIVTQGRKKIL